MFHLTYKNHRAGEHNISTFRGSTLEKVRGYKYNWPTNKNWILYVHTCTSSWIIAQIGEYCTVNFLGYIMPFDHGQSNAFHDQTVHKMLLRGVFWVPMAITCNSVVHERCNRLYYFERFVGLLHSLGCCLHLRPSNLQYFAPAWKWKENCPNETDCCQLSDPSIQGEGNLTNFSRDFFKLPQTVTGMCIQESIFLYRQLLP